MLPLLLLSLLIIIIKMELTALPHGSVRRVKSEENQCVYGAWHAGGPLRRPLPPPTPAAGSPLETSLQSFPRPHWVGASVTPPAGRKGGYEAWWGGAALDHPRPSEQGL